MRVSGPLLISTPRSRIHGPNLAASAGDWRRYSTLVCAPGSAILRRSAAAVAPARPRCHGLRAAARRYVPKRKDRPPPDAGLTQPAAGHLAPAQRALNEGLAAAQQRSDRRAQSFRQANGEGVAVLHDLFQRQVQRHGGVEDARAVDMQRQLPLAGKLPRLLQVGLRQNSAADGFPCSAAGCGRSGYRRV